VLRWSDWPVMASPKPDLGCLLFRGGSAFEPALGSPPPTLALRLGSGCPRSGTLAQGTPRWAFHGPAGLSRHPCRLALRKRTYTRPAERGRRPQGRLESRTVIFVSSVRLLKAVRCASNLGWSFAAGLCGSPLPAGRV
jgi:hypothetical protein